MTNITDNPAPALGTLFTGQLVQLAAAGGKAFNETLARWSLDADFNRHFNTGPSRPESPFAFESDGHENNQEYPFAIRTLADDKLIGEGGLEVDWNHQGAWLSIGIGEADYRGKGYGTDAVRLLVGYGFRELGLYRITLGVFSYNTRAIRCYQKVGFVHEQTERAALYRDGQRFDTYIMGLLRPEWDTQIGKPFAE